MPGDVWKREKCYRHRLCLCHYLPELWQSPYFPDSLNYILLFLSALRCDWTVKLLNWSQMLFHFFFHILENERTVTEVKAETIKQTSSYWMFAVPQRTDTRKGKGVTPGAVKATEVTTRLASLPAPHSLCRASLGGGCYFKPCFKAEETGEPGHRKIASGGMFSTEYGRETEGRSSLALRLSSFVLLWNAFVCMGLRSRACTQEVVDARAERVWALLLVGVHTRDLDYVSGKVLQLHNACWIASVVSDSLWPHGL